MVRLNVLASGSQGNASVVSTARTRLLVDCGLSCRETTRRLAAVGLDPGQLDAILITHEHIDHVNGLGAIARKLGIPVYMTEATHSAWKQILSPRRHRTYAEWVEELQRNAALKRAGAVAGQAAEAPPPPPQAETKKKKDPSALPAIEFFSSGQPFQIGDITVRPFTTPHDAADPVGFVFLAEGIRVGFATDLGYMPSNVLEHLSGAHILLLESNHDLDMLRDGPYPWCVKQRVLSRTGHLSNDAAAGFLAEHFDGAATTVILAHLSQSNNLPELARIAVGQALDGRGFAPRLLVGEQDAPIEPVTL